MRWSIIRLICLRELRDQLRDRRTLFMIAGLPLLLYPVLGFAVLQFAVGFVERPSTVGVVRGPLQSGDFPARAPAALRACFAIAPVGARREAPASGPPVAVAIHRQRRRVSTWLQTPGVGATRVRCGATRPRDAPPEIQRSTASSAAASSSPSRYSMIPSARAW